MATVLVTGGGGFLGRHIVNLLLLRGDSVAVLNRSSYPDLETRGVTCHCGDLRDKKAVAKALVNVETVFHVAAKAGIWGAEEEYYGINVLGTKNLLDCSREAGVKKFVYTSSPSVVYGTEALDGADETLPYPDTYLTAYPKTKAEAEKMVLAASCDDFLTCSLRPHLIWGPGDNHLIPRILESAASGKLMQVGDGENKVDITYVENGAMAHIQAEEALKPGSVVAGQAYFIGDAQEVKLWPWINDLLVEAGQQPLKKKISYGKAKFIGMLMEIFYKFFRLKSEPRMTRFVAAQLATSHYFSHEKAKRDFGYIAPIDSKIAMKRTMQWLHETKL